MASRGDGERRQLESMLHTDRNFEAKHEERTVRLIKKVSKSRQTVKWLPTAT